MRDRGVAIWRPGRQSLFVFINLMVWANCDPDPRQTPGQRSRGLLGTASGIQQVGSARQGPGVTCR